MTKVIQKNHVVPKEVKIILDSIKINDLKPLAEREKYALLYMKNLTLGFLEIWHNKFSGEVTVEVLNDELEEICSFPLKNVHSPYSIKAS